MTGTAAPPGWVSAADPGFVVRRVTPADAARVRALRLEMLADSPLAFYETLAQAASRSHEDFCRRIDQASSGRGYAQFVADPGGRLIGQAGGTTLPQERDATVVFSVYITPERRGSGVLEELIAYVARWSKAMGRPELMLEVVVGNDRAVRAYERLGFADTGVRMPHPVLPTLTQLQMRRPA
jgi:ribosomal protein S18 acetylase RimI-like enzyme